MNAEQLLRAALSSLCLVCLLLVLVAGCESSNTTTPQLPENIELVRQVAGRGELIALAPTGHLAVLTGDLLVVLNAVEGDTVFSVPSPIQASLYTDRDLTFSDDGHFLAASVNNGLIVADLTSHIVLLSEIYSHGHALQSMGALVFSPDNSQLLIGGQMRQVFAMDLPTGHLADSLSQQSSVAGLSILPDSRTAAVATFDGSVLLWMWKENIVVDTLGSCQGWCSSFASTYRYLMAGCRGDSIRVWNSRTLELHGFLQGHRFIGLDFASSSLADLLIAGSGPGSSQNSEDLTTSEVLVFDLDTLQPVASWRAHSADGIYDTAMNPDGSLFATCGYDKVVSLWRLKER